MNEINTKAPTPSKGVQTRSRRTFRRLLLAFAALVGAVAIGVAVNPAPAAASATGCSWWGPHTVGGITLQTGEECASVNGSGLYVSGTSVSYNSPWGNVCNWREVDQFRDIYGNVYWTVYGPTHLGCWHANWDSISINANVRAGSVSVLLQQNGGTITGVTHSIHS